MDEPFTQDKLLVLTKSDLIKIILSQTKMIRKLSDQVNSLEERLAKNSRNSSKPPSSDGYDKPAPRSQRKASGRKQGGQKGHKGYRLEPVENPDKIEIHAIEICEQCGCSLEDIVAKDHECRQEMDVTKPEPKVTEHRGEIKICQECGFVNKAKFPDRITQPTQYGPQLKAFATYYSQNHLIPYKRLQEIFKDCHNIDLSTGTLVNFNNQCYKILEPVETAIKKDLIEGAYVHFDESGMRSQGKLNWLHSASTEKVTYYMLHEKRGRIAMDDMAILPNFNGTAIHDHWKVYFSYDCDHSLCNAHHLRELKYVNEVYEQQWATNMIELLLQIKGVVEKAKHAGKTTLSDATLYRYAKKYSTVLEDGFLEIPLLEPTKKRGKPKQHKSKNLWDRLRAFRQETLRFMYDFNVPFDNNLAERDIRMCKVKQKISGCFRGSSGGAVFSRIRSYVSTVRKHEVNVLDALRDAFFSTPFLPDTI